MVNGLLFHMTQPTSRSIIKAIACSKPIVSEQHLLYFDEIQAFKTHA